MGSKEELDGFIDECIRRSVEKGHHPTRFMSMRERYGTMNAIVRLVESSDEQSGFIKARELDLIPWCLESAVIRFKDQFGKKTLAYAVARLDGRFFR